MNKYLSWFIIMLLALGVSAGAARAEDNESSANGGRACTMEAKLCPDGSSVGRSGPDCEFSACPGSSDKDDGDNSGKGDEGNRTLRDAARHKLEDLRGKIKDEKDAAKARIKELRITGRENALQRFDAAVTRISNLKDRVNARIAILEAKGVDVASAKVFVATSTTKLNAAAVKITEINAVLAVSINELSAADKTKLRTLAGDTQTLIKDAHQALRDAVQSLKANLKIKMEAEADND